MLFVRLVNLLILCTTIAACGNNYKYKYVEVVNYKSVTGDTYEKEKEALEIVAPTDSAAYLEAYKKFNISLKIARQMQKVFGDTYTIPKRFKLLNSSGNDICNTVEFADRKQKEAEVLEYVFKDR